jgi:site-specific recombinase XerD
MPDNPGKPAPLIAFSDPTAALPAVPLEDLAQAAEDLARASLSPATRRAYQAAWTAFETWCHANALPALPAAPETLALYVAWLAPQKGVRTIGKALAAITLAHRSAGLDSPTEAPLVRRVARGLRRTYGKPPMTKDPIRVEDLYAMVRQLDEEDIIDLRDRALLLLGWAGAFRRSELVGIDVADLREVREGLVVQLRRSKTDQEGEGRKVGIPKARRPALCPVAAVKTWLVEAEITQGPLFRVIDRWGNIQDQRLSDRAVALIIQRTTERAGLDPAPFAGHSLRSGFCTEAARAGVSERAIMSQTGHKSTTTLRGYIRDGGMFLDHPGAKLL